MLDLVLGVVQLPFRLRVVLRAGLDTDWRAIRG